MLNVQQLETDVWARKDRPVTTAQGEAAFLLSFTRLAAFQEHTHTLSLESVMS